MTIEVIGAGFGRTGTLSLKFALETLGIDKCYHMMEVMLNEGHVAQWRQAAQDE
ncbi:MAG: sulfotransferase, partial [Pseudomonadota bacterium]|nr:sulfotransferase [Pseudomonadota bacterium]